MKQITIGPQLQFVLFSLFFFFSSVVLDGLELHAQTINANSTNPTCENSADGSITITVSGGTSPYTYNWTGTGVNTLAQNQSNLTQGTYSVEVTDSSDPAQSTSETFTLTAVDNEDPTITAPANVSANTSDDGNGDCTTSVDLGTPTSNDNCEVESVKAFVNGGEINPNNYSFPIGTTTVTWTVTDTSNRTASDDQTVTVSDNENPTISAPANVSANTSDDGNGDCTTSVDLGIPTSNDNCEVESVKAFVNGGEINPNNYSFPIGTTTVTWTVTDTSNQTASDDQTVTVSDNENPTISAPANVSANTSDDGNGDCTTSVDLGTPTSDDNCEVESVKAFVNGSEINPNNYSFPIGTTVVTWTATDTSNRTASDDQTVTVSDNEDPTISAPADVSANTSVDGNGDCTTSVDLGTPTSNDNCEVDSVKAFVNGDVINPDTYEFPIGSTTVTWTVTDASGRMSSDDQNVVVTDNELPVITTTGTVNSFNDNGLCEANVIVPAPTITDNCNVGAASGVRSDNKSLSDPYPVGTTVITWTVTDDNNNDAIPVEQQVIVTDNEEPVLPVLETITWGCEYTAKVPVTSDNCDDEVTATTEDPTTFNTSGTYTITWKFTDKAGNSVSVNQTVIIDLLALDLSATEIECNGFQTAQATANLNGGVQPYYYTWINKSTNEDLGSNESITNLPAGTYQVTASDVNGCELIDEITISEPDVLAMTNPSSTPVSCNEGSDGSIIVGTMTGGTGPYSYSLDNTNYQNNISFSNLQAGDYTIFVQDANACSLQKDVSVSEPNPLDGNLSKTDVNCFEGQDGTIEVSNVSGGNAGYQYSLDNISWQDAQLFDGLIAGNYTVYIRDQSVQDCVVELGSINVDEPASPLAINVTTTSTTGADTATGSATANPTGGTSGYTFKWFKAGTAAVIQTTRTAGNLKAGDYVVEVTDQNGCIESQDVTILDRINAEIDPRSICEGGAGDIRTSYYTVLDGSATGGVGPYTYNWNFGNGASPVNATTTDGNKEYRVKYNSEGVKEIRLTVTDSRGESELFIIEQFIGQCFANNCGSNDLRIDDFYVGDANGNRLNSADCASIGRKYLYLALDPGPDRYSLYVEVSYVKENRFFNTSPEGVNKTGTFFCNETIPDQARLFEIENWICGDQVTIEGVYLTFQNNKNKKCGTSNKPKCYGSDDGNEVTTPLFGIATPNEIPCNGLETGVIEVNAAGGEFPYDYSITSATAGFQSGKRFADLPAGTYSAWIKDSQGTIYQTDEVTILEPTNPITLTTAVTEPICFGALGEATVNVTEGSGTPFESGEPYQYLWNDAENQNTKTATNLAAGNYTVTVIDANGCQEIADVTITEPEQLTVPAAGEDQNLGCGITEVTLNANVAEVGVGSWSIADGSSAGGTITDPSNPTSTFTGVQGTYILNWTITNAEGNCGDDNFDSVEIIIDGDCSKLDFDGIDDYIDFGDNYGFSSGNFTFEVWVKPESISGSQTILSKRDVSTGNNGYELIINNGSPTFKWNGKTVSTSSKVNTSRWFHIAVIYDGTARLYVDGIDVGNATGTNPSTSVAPYLLGATYNSANPTTPQSHFSGWMEELRIWNVALTQTQLRFMMNQRATANGDVVRGSVLPLDVPGNLAWSALKGYYKLVPGEIVDGKTLDLSNTPVSGAMRNIDTDQYQSAPLPYISEASGKWRTRSTWDTNIGNAQENWWGVPNGVGINNTKINWNIAKIKHNIDSDATDISLLGLYVDENKLDMIGSNSAQSGNALTVTKYLSLDGILDLNGESQLIQTEGSILEENSVGYLERDQQGTENSYNYNYWTSPVSTTGGSINSGFSLSSVLWDGTNPDEPAGINYNYQFHWADSDYSGELRLSTYWLHSFQGTADDYFQWSQFSEDDVLKPGIGFSMKGTRGSAAVSSKQNYTFRGLPNNGDISVNVGTDQNLLTGNPYPSALDAQKFIQDNIQNFNGNIYLWDHFGAEYSHYLEEYVGGYAVFNLSGGIAAASSIDSRINANNDKSQKSSPGKYVPVGQAFFINTKGVSNPDKITFRNSYRTFVKESSSDSQFHSQEDDPKKSDENKYEKDTRHKIRLKLESPKGYHRQILATADVNTTDGFDLGYDAPLIENNVEDLYWMIDESEFVIQGVPDFNKARVLPIGFKIAEAGEYTIKIDELENIQSDIDIYLLDTTTEEYHDLMKSDYTVSTDSVGVFNEKYQIVFQKLEEEVSEEVVEEKPEVIEESDPDFLDMRYLRQTDEIALYNPDLQNIDFVELYSVSGQKIMTFSEIPTEESISLRIQQKLSSAVYVVKIYVGKKSYSKKVIITK
ncbi:LamG-like jellyroll fold domain-containing protein [Christiangramia sp. OXR-203]|jgi:hypothetical protein|uniref:LamG-like jellyroll fold domain-containing protein n=1 Tax=Christiangramia sp. OXR-203 TaxID=3100176 RepID=UPI002AC8BFE7|nr:LamG-like jellyroll fold domain-containing protein [Christiangramia sp. OXR-203]WPY98028.1 LamG-like jellyroll fold domain-containing protein [Christiangramia sp. OXR-203]